MALVEGDEEHVHIFQWSALLVKLWLQDGVIHQINSSHAADYDVAGLVGSIISLMVWYADHLLWLICRSAGDYWGVGDGVEIAAVVVHGAIAARTDTAVLIEGICLVYCSLGTWCHGTSVRAILHLADCHVADAGVHYLRGRYLPPTTLIHLLLHILLIRTGCIFWAIRPPRRPLPPHMHLLILRRSWSLRDHGAISNSRIYHRNLAALRCIMRLLLSNEVLL